MNIHDLCRYGGFSLGARSTQVLPPAEEIDDAIGRVREIFHLQKGSGTAADRFLRSLSAFINGLDTKNNVKVHNYKYNLIFYY